MLDKAIMMPLKRTSMTQLPYSNKVVVAAQHFQVVITNPSLL